jgi:polysaccharide biosynthesis/export protein
LKNSRTGHRQLSMLYYAMTVALVACFIMLATSCGNVKHMQYLQGNLDTAAIAKIPYEEAKIQKGDLLSITVFSDNASATAATTNPSPGLAPGSTQPDGTGSGASSPSTASGYLVDQQGNIQLFKVGILHVEGMTKKMLADTLVRFFIDKQLLMNPYVEVRFLNYRITLIGEVNKPGTFSLPSDRINAFEAIGLAGDITVYGRRDNVLVIRETDGVRTFGHLDLSKPEVFLSPFFYLKQSDMIIVDVAKNKAAATDQTTVRNITIGTSILSTIAIFISLFRR